MRAKLRRWDDMEKKHSRHREIKDELGKWKARKKQGSTVNLDDIKIEITKKENEIKEKQEE